ncbi:ATP-grasp domain-containing protein [Paenibacillus sp. GCM10027626]|uniref:ATP-grasp domain-containing protein n=1 Tax=Paenibacillus sp. GCM10027626 TaxID=3273411 RepID=UPI00362EDF43
MRVLFCADPLNEKRVDPDYELEYIKAKELGVTAELVSLEHLFEGNCTKAVKLIPPAEAMETIVYRGWMMKPEQYKRLYDTLKLRNLFLINTPEQYMNGHYFPNSYEAIRSVTPLSIWLDKQSIEESWGKVQELLLIFGNKPIIIKDYVKSRKHEWEEACYIPDASDRRHVQHVVGNLLERQGAELSGGVVFREFVELEQLLNHPKSGMPLSNEFRLFFLNHNLLLSTEYWDEVSYAQEMPRLEPFVEVAQGIDSRFFTVDIAKTRKGDWVVIEVGDGQVSGLPGHTNIEAFYRSLQALLV